MLASKPGMIFLGGGTNMDKSGHNKIYEYHPDTGFSLRSETVAKEATYPIIIPYNEI